MVVGEVKMREIVREGERLKEGEGDRCKWSLAEALHPIAKMIQALVFVIIQAFSCVMEKEQDSEKLLQSRCSDLYKRLIGYLSSLFFYDIFLPLFFFSSVHFLSNIGYTSVSATPSNTHWKQTPSLELACLSFIFSFFGGAPFLLPFFLMKFWLDVVKLLPKAISPAPKEIEKIFAFTISTIETFPAKGTPASKTLDAAVGNEIGYMEAELRKTVSS